MVGPEPWINSFHPWVIGSATIRSIQPQLGDTLCISIQPRTVGSAHPSCFPVFCSGRPAVGMVKSKHPSSSKSSKKEDGYKKEEAATGKLKVKKTVEKKQKEKKMPSTHKDSKTKSMPGKRRPETQDAKDTTKKAKVQNDAHAKAVKASRTEKIHKIGEEKKKTKEEKKEKDKKEKDKKEKDKQEKDKKEKGQKEKEKKAESAENNGENKEKLSPVNPPARRVSGKSKPEEGLQTPPTRPPPCPSPSVDSVPSTVLSMENISSWKKEAQDKGITLEQYMEDISRQNFEEPVEEHMRQLMKEQEEVKAGNRADPNKDPEEEEDNEDEGEDDDEEEKDDESEDSDSSEASAQTVPTSSDSEQESLDGSEDCEKSDVEEAEEDDDEEDKGKETGLTAEDLAEFDTLVDECFPLHAAGERGASQEKEQEPKKKDEKSGEEEEKKKQEKPGEEGTKEANKDKEEKENKDLGEVVEQQRASSGSQFDNANSI